MREFVQISEISEILRERGTERFRKLHNQTTHSILLEVKDLEFLDGAIIVEQWVHYKK